MCSRIREKIYIYIHPSTLAATLEICKRYDPKIEYALGVGIYQSSPSVRYGLINLGGISATMNPVFHARI